MCVRMVSALRAYVRQPLHCNPVDATLSHYTLSHYVFQGLEGCRLGESRHATPAEKGPVTPAFSALKGGVALRVASCKVSQYRGGVAAPLGDRKGTTKKLCDKDFAERSGELSGAICRKTLVLLGNDR